MIRIECKGSGLIDIDDIKPFQGNLKELSKDNYEKLKKQILDHGFSAPFFIWDKTNECLDGHQRLNVLLKMRGEGIAIPKLPYVHIQAKSKKEAKQKLASFASQYGKMTSDGLYEFLSEADISFDEAKGSFSFPEIDFKKFENEFYKEEAVEGEDEVPATRPTTIQRGDLFTLGNHRLLCGDSTDAASVGKLMSGEKADMVYTDPPYGISYDDERWQKKPKQTQQTVRNRFGMIQNDDVDFDPGFIFQTFIETKEIFIWGAANFCQKLPKDGSWIVWDRKTEAQADCPYGDFDLCWSKSKHAWKMVRIMWGGFHSKEKGEDRHHPTEKPVRLHEWFFERWGKEKTNIVDLYLGSGSTLIACEKTNRKCFGMEIDPQYCQVIIDRWEKFTGKKAILEAAENSAEIQHVKSDRKTIQKRTVGKPKRKAAAS